MDNEIIEKVKSILEVMNPYMDISEETLLLEERVLDSMAIFVFLTRLEEEFNIEIADEEITRDNFSTIGDVVLLVKRAQG